MVSNSSLVVTSTTTRTEYTGISLADGFQGLHQSVQGGSWVDGILAGGSLVGDAAATVIDPFGALLANGLGWTMEHFEPLRDVLDKLTGIPDKVTAHRRRGRTWPVRSRPWQRISSRASPPICPTGMAAPPSRTGR